LRGSARTARARVQGVKHAGLSREACCVISQVRAEATVVHRATDGVQVATPCQKCRILAGSLVVLFVGALTGVWAGWGVVGVAQCCHRQLWQWQGAYKAAIRFSKPAPTRFPYFPASSMASSGSIDLLLLFRCFPEVGRGRFGPFLCHFHLLALAFPFSFWVGLVSDSGTIACLQESCTGACRAPLVMHVTLSQDLERIFRGEWWAPCYVTSTCTRHPEPYDVCPPGETRVLT
jgi:hypothetical protein